MTASLRTRRETAHPPRCIRRFKSLQAWNPWVIYNARAEVSAQFRPKFFSNVMRIGSVTDNLWPDEDDQLGTGRLVVLMGKGVAQPRNLIEQGNPVSAIVLLFADQSG